MPSQADQHEQAILEALRRVIEPGGKNLVDAGLVAGVKEEREGLILVLRAGSLPEPVRERIGRETFLALKAAGIANISVEWGADATEAPSEPVAPSIRHIVAVGSGKGGVGKSTVAASLAYALTQRGHRVGLMDADVYGPSIPHMLGLEGRPAIANNQYQPLVADGIKTISMGFLVPPKQAVVWRGPMLHKAVRDFLYQVNWGELDFLIVDLPPGTGDVVLSLSQQMPLAGGVIVCTPQDVALLDARKALSMFHTVKIPCLGIVENMSFFLCPSCGSRSEIFGHGGAQKWAKEEGIRFLGGIPINLGMRLHGDQGRLRDNLKEGSETRSILLDISDRLLESIRSNQPPTVPTLEIV